MRLTVNLRLYVKGQIGGIENYVRHVVRAIAKQQQAAQAEWTVFGIDSELQNIGEFAPGASLFPVTHETAEMTIAEELRRPYTAVVACFFRPVLSLFIHIPLDVLNSSRMTVHVSGASHSLRNLN